MLIEVKILNMGEKKICYFIFGGEIIKICSYFKYYYIKLYIKYLW